MWDNDEYYAIKELVLDFTVYFMNKNYPDLAEKTSLANLRDGINTWIKDKVSDRQLPNEE